MYIQRNFWVYFNLLSDTGPNMSFILFYFFIFLFYCFYLIFNLI